MQQAVHVHVHQFDLETGVLVLTVQQHDGVVLVEKANVGFEIKDGVVDIEKVLDQIARSVGSRIGRAEHDEALADEPNLGPLLRIKMAGEVNKWP